MIENLTIHTADVAAPTTVKGTSGANERTYSVVKAGLVCKVDDADPQWGILYAQKQARLTHQVFTTDFTPVQVGYRLLWQGKILRVLGVKDLAGMGQIHRIDCQELEGEGS